MSQGAVPSILGGRLRTDVRTDVRTNVHTDVRQMFVRTSDEILTTWRNLKTSRSKNLDTPLDITARIKSVNVKVKTVVVVVVVVV